jgi:hypothetical protein
MQCFFYIACNKEPLLGSSHFQHWQLLWASWAWVASTWIGSSVFLGVNFRLFLTKKIWKILEKCVLLG